MADRISEAEIENNGSSGDESFLSSNDATVDEGPVLPQIKKPPNKFRSNIHIPVDTYSASSNSPSTSNLTRAQEQELSPGLTPPPSPQRQCWVCFATEMDDPDTEWVRPCKCRGSMMWVHQKCLQRWIDEKQRGNTFASVSCRSCGYTYAILYPPSNLAVLVMERIEKMISHACPLMTGGLLVGSLYWSACTYGAITVVELLGWERGIRALETSDPLVLLVGLPTIPFALVTFKMIRWEDKIVAWLRDRYITRQTGNTRRLAVPVEGAVVGNGAAAPAANDQQQQPLQQQIVLDATSATRILIGALALPTIAVVVGKLVCGDSVSSPLKRTCYGGAIYLAVRGAAKIYFKYKQLVRQNNRKIMDYRPPVDLTNTLSRNVAAGDNLPLDIQP